MPTTMTLPPPSTTAAGTSAGTSSPHNTCNEAYKISLTRHQQQRAAALHAGDAGLRLCSSMLILQQSVRNCNWDAQQLQQYIDSHYAAVCSYSDLWARIKLLLARAVSALPQVCSCIQFTISITNFSEARCRAKGWILSSNSTAPSCQYSRRSTNTAPNFTATRWHCVSFHMQLQSLGREHTLYVVQAAPARVTGGGQIRRAAQMLRSAGSRPDGRC